MSQSADDAFPTQQLTVLALCRLAEPIAFTSILAYTYVMVQDLQGGDDTNASFYAGLLVSAFAVAEASTAMVWGSISDRYGRKPIVLIGLAGTALSSLIFGFAKRYWVALVARLIGGLLNGNVAVLQTMVAEMVKRPEHEPRAYAVQPFMWSLGSIIGAAMGGFLAQPTRYYPSVFPADGIFGEYPYLLPNLIAALVIVLAIVQGMIFLKETNPRARHTSERASANERTPLRLQGRRVSAADAYSTGPRRSSFVAESAATNNEPNFDLRRGSMATMYSISIVSTNQRAREQSVLEPIPEAPVKAFNRGVITMTISLILMSYHQMAFGSIMPIYLLDNPENSQAGVLDLRGGLGYTVHDVGTFMAVNGVIALFIQGVIFPFFVQRVGVWYSLVALTICHPISYIIVPLISLLPPSAAPAGVYITLTVQNFFSVLITPCALILLKDAVPSSLVLGKVNGLAMSACSGARTIAPPLAGIIYSAGGSAAAWWSCAAFALVAIVELYWIPKGDIVKVVVENPLRTGNDTKTITEADEESRA